MNDHFDLVAKSGEMFVDGIVDDFIDHVMQTAFVRVTDIHARPLSNRFQTLEFVDLSSVVLLRFINAGREAFIARNFVVFHARDGSSGWHRKNVANSDRKTTNNLVAARGLFALWIGGLAEDQPTILWSAAKSYSHHFLLA